ncbi:MAG: Nucleoid-associated protein [bacterium ADurb.Bin478]|nr:MAG: Nucleoid-associated protein [bacterium ADurb.Bin478]
MMNKGAMSGLLKQAQKMQEELAKAQAALADLRVSGSAGGNMVTVTANGSQEILQIKIDPEVVNPQDVEMLEDLVLAAVNQALVNSRAAAEEQMAKATGGFNPGDMLGGLKIPGLS